MEKGTRPYNHILAFTLEGWLEIGRKVIDFQLTEEEILEAMTNKTGLIKKQNGYECYLLRGKNVKDS